MTATFQLDGQEFFALNGGPQFTFLPAISFFVNCETQQVFNRSTPSVTASPTVANSGERRLVTRLLPQASG